MEDTAHGRATSLEHWGRVIPGGSIPLSSLFFLWAGRDARSTRERQIQIFWVVGRVVMQLTFNQHHRGSIPLPPT